MPNESAQALALVQRRLRAVGCDALLRRDRRGISIFGPEGQPVARLRNLGEDGWEVLWWSHRDKWESIGDLGGIVCDDVDEALAYVLDDPMGVFW
jgi:hypothetical protein